MSCNTDNTIRLNKDCAGRDCDNIGTINLKIKYIKRSGLFCESCALELKIIGLIDDENEGGINKA